MAEEKGDGRHGKTEVGRQKSKVGGWKSEVGGQGYWLSESGKSAESAVQKQIDCSRHGCRYSRIERFAELIVISGIPLA